MPGALPSVSLSFHPRPGFLRKSNTKLRAVKHLGMCSLLRIHLGKRILSSFFFYNFGHSKSINHSRFCYALPQIWIMKLMLLFKCRRSGRLQELKNKWNGPAGDSQEWSSYGYCCLRKLYITALLKSVQTVFHWMLLVIRGGRLWECRKENSSCISKTLKIRDS